MGFIRTYFDKDNVIMRNSCINTGRNPIAEIFHGGALTEDDLSFSRYLINFDLSDLIDKYNNNEIFLENLTHELKLTNTSCFDNELYCKTFCGAQGTVNRATGFDLILFKIPESWDEGNGYDYVEAVSICEVDDKSFCEGPSNWFDRSFDVTWAQNGVYTNPNAWYSGSTTGYTGTTIDLVIGTQHFDHGNENLCIDVTSHINSLISSGITNNGLGIAFTYNEERVLTKCVQYVGFFTRETQTVYEPFIETTIDCTISDDRDNFYLDRDNRLYLYVNAGGERTNAIISGVTIYDQNDNVYQNIVPSGITQCSRGVYYIDLNVSSDPISGYCGNIMFRDVWDSVTINGNDLGDVELDFVIKDKNDYYNIGSVNSAGASGLGVGDANNISIYDYAVSIHGIKRKEKIKRGDTRRVNVDARIPFTIDQSESIDKMYYRIFIKEGQTQIEYIGWSEIDKTPDGNFFLLDTSWFIANDYYLEVKFESGNEVRTYNDIIEFQIVSERDWC